MTTVCRRSVNSVYLQDTILRSCPKTAHVGEDAQNRSRVTMLLRKEGTQRLVVNDLDIIILIKYPMVYINIIEAMDIQRNFPRLVLGS